MTSIASAFANLPIRRPGDRVSPTNEPAPVSIFQLQSIPTSARMVKTWTRAAPEKWKAERPSTTATITEPPPPSTIPDRSALPYLIGGFNTLGASPRDRAAISRLGSRGGALTSRSRTTSTAGFDGNDGDSGSTKLPKLAGTARPSASRKASRAPGGAAGSDDDHASSLERAPRVRGANDHRCGPQCAVCGRLRTDVANFEKLHPEVADPPELAGDGDRDTPDQEMGSTSNLLLLRGPAITSNNTSQNALHRNNTIRTPPQNYNLSSESNVLPNSLMMGSTSSPAALTSADDFANPLSGLLSTTELHVIQGEYQAFLNSIHGQARTARLKNSTSSSSASELNISTNVNTVSKFGLTLDDFRALLARLVPHVSISVAYAQRMFEPFALPSTPARAPFRTIFAFLCRKNGSAVVERNVRFFFQCLDERGVGRISSRVFTHNVIGAWAENRVIGKAIYAWRGVAQAFERVRPDWVATLTTNPAPPKELLANLLPGEVLVSIDELRAQVYSYKALTDAFAHGLECVLTDQPRYAPKPAPPPGIKLSFRRTSEPGLVRAASFTSQP